MKMNIMMIRLGCWMFLSVIAVAPAWGREESAAVPRVERVVPIDKDPALQTPGVFFSEGFETLDKLKDVFPDTAEGTGKFNMTKSDPFTGKTSLEQTYVARDKYADKDKGSAGWVTRFFGDSPLYASKISDKTQQRRIFARWYHKFPAGFDGVVGGKFHFPPKMARVGCKDKGWKKVFSILYWIEDGDDANLVIERHTVAPGTHREWIPKSVTPFACNNPENLGRWVHMELGVILGDGPRSDRVMAWADGKLIADIPNDDLTAGWKGLGLTNMMWDCYWNGGSPKDQSRFYDDLAISNQGPIGPARSGFNPEIILAPGKGKPQAYEVEVGEGSQKPLKVAKVFDQVPGSYEPLEINGEVVWKSSVKGKDRVKVDAASGQFVGPRAGKSELSDNTLHFVRVRQQNAEGAWSEWSGWHAGFATDWKAGCKPEEKTAPKGLLLGTGMK